MWELIRVSTPYFLKSRQLFLNCWKVYPHALPLPFLLGGQFSIQHFVKGDSEKKMNACGVWAIK